MTRTLQVPPVCHPGRHLASFLGTSGGIGETTVGEVTMDLEGAIGGNTEYSSRVQAVYDMYGPTNFLTMSDPCPSNNPQTSQIDHNGSNSPESMLIGGSIQQNVEKVTLANPIHFVSKDDPPFLIAHGTNDALVPNCNSIELLPLLVKMHVLVPATLVIGLQLNRCTNLSYM
ncbi:MAG: hypothetical protein ACLFVQ_11310 [Chitinispirillaceae bacterium]